MSQDAGEQILNGARQAAKTFAFADQNPSVPAQWWFQTSHEGLILFAVFYTQACRWNRCLGCNLPAKSSLHPVGFRHIMAQVDHLLGLPEVRTQADNVQKVIVSNNGSMLDEVTFPSTALFYLLARLNERLPHMRVLTLETRAEYVDWDELAYISRALREREEPAALELGIGFEVFNDRIRNEVFHKGLTLASFERLVRMMAPYGYHLKSYLMQKPVPGMTDDEGVDDIRSAIDYHARLGAEHSVQMNLHIHPAYVAHGTVLAEAFAAGQYAPPRLVDVARAVRSASGKGVSVYVGLFDEDLAVPGGSFVRPGDEALVARLEEFNRTQDFALLA